MNERRARGSMKETLTGVPDGLAPLVLARLTEEVDPLETMW